MPISTKCLINQSNSCLAGSPSELNLAQVSGVKSSNTVYSVASTSVLPVASCNKGRMIFVEDIGAYRYSDGEEWTNSYDSTCTIAKTPIFSWGFGDIGTIGNGATVRSSSPIQEITSGDWSQLGTGDRHVLAIKTDGTLWGWGCGAQGRLGNNSISNFSSPVQEYFSDATWCYIAPGTNHTAAIKTDGTLWSSGLGNGGQIGNGAASINNCTLIQELTSSIDWCQAAGGEFTVAVKTTGQVWLWGCNAAGQIGDETIINKSSPVREISSSTDWSQVSASQYHTLAIKTDGTLWGWGRNIPGAIGTGDTLCYSSPVQEITSSTDWCQSSAAEQHSAALKTDNTLWVWGSGNLGRTGTGNGLCYSSPVQEITSSTDWCQVCAYAVNTAAVKTSGQLLAWGWNVAGQIGDGTTIDRSSPVQEITSSTNWYQVGIGSSFISSIKQTIKGFNEP